MGILEGYLQDKFKTTKDAYQTVFDHFDRNSDGFLDSQEFEDFLTELFQCNGKSSENLSPSVVSCLLSVLDLDEDGKLGMEDFRYAWLYWLRQVMTMKFTGPLKLFTGSWDRFYFFDLLLEILKPKRALVIVDVQNDFISGSLSLCNCPSQHDGNEVVPIINKMLEDDLFDVVVYTYDWHPEDHISFIDNIHTRPMHLTSKLKSTDAKVMDTVVFDVKSCQREQTMWPKHCVQGSWGSQLHSQLKVVPDAYHVQKGMNPDVDSYSAFWDNDKLSQTNLASILKEKCVTDVYVCGLAYDVCVGFTAHHSVEHGFRTVFIEDASRGVCLDGISKVKSELVSKGVHMASANEVPKLIRCEERPMSLAIQAAVNYKVAWEIVRGHSKPAL